MRLSDWRSDIRCDATYADERASQPTLSPDFRTYPTTVRIYGLGRIPPGTAAEDEFNGWVEATFGVTLGPDSWNESEEHDCPTCRCDGEVWVEFRTSIVATSSQDVSRRVSGVRYPQAVAS